MRMNVARSIFVILILLSGTEQSVQAQSGQVTRTDYERAEQRLPWNAEALVSNESVDPHWIDSQGAGEDEQFWYRHELEGGGSRFRVVNPVTAAARPAFDHEQLASSLSEATRRNYQPDHLPFDSFSFTGEGEITFSFNDKRWVCSLSGYSCAPKTQEERRPGASPDGQWVAFVEEQDLHLRSQETGAEHRLTTDGRERYAYATPLPSPSTLVAQDTTALEPQADVNWGPSSEQFVTYRIDARGATRMSLIESSPDDRWHPRTYTYVYPLGGDERVPMAKLYIFNAETQEQIEIDAPPVPMLYYGGGPYLNWSEGGERLYFMRRDRDSQRIRLIEVNANTGTTTTLIEERSTTEGPVDPHMTSMEMIGGGEEILWRSERDGWSHLYLYDGKTGELKRQLTEGEWVVRSIVHVDEEERQVFFLASGREEGYDPYLRQLYRVNLDGSNLTRLTPEQAGHDVSFSPEGTYFVDTYSRINEAPVTVVRRSLDGSVVYQVAKANLSQLHASGWVPPRTFTVKAADGHTDLYGVMWYPSDFDPTRSYPIVEQIYTGPHSFHVPKTFGEFRTHQSQAMAELGFIVVMVDGRGTGRRSRAFRNYSYENLGGVYGDHVAAIRQLAERHTYLDTSRVGIFGHSAGGYDSAHAILTHPDFYKVAVSSSGNHSHRMDKAWWNELWMGYPAGEHYESQSNMAAADQLEGDLLLVHGELDENVPPTATMKLVDALIEANEDFDLLILPGEDHGMRDNPYFIRRRWDYFVKHLADETPPEEFQIAPPEDG